MKLKLDYSEFMALLSIMRIAAYRPKEKRVTDQLVQIMIIRIFKKFHKNELELKKQYSIKLDEAEAVAFWLYFANTGLPETSHSGNLIEGIRSAIHQKLI